MDKISSIINYLDNYYGKKQWKRSNGPVEELIRTILSQNTTDKNSNKTYANLIANYKTWDNLLEAKESDIAKLIKMGGLANTKAKKIKACLLEIKKREGKIDLEFLNKYDINKAQDYLLSLNGVGPKTAACVLIFSFNMPILPVDTHIHRVSNRLGILTTKTREKTQEILNQIIPPKNKYSFHLNIIEHGRTTCKANTPLCNDCFLKNLCDYYNN